MKTRTGRIADILPFGNSQLRAECKAVSVFHGGLASKIDLLRNTLAKNGGGAALAAPQIGLLKRIVVIRYLGEYHEMINPTIEDRQGSVDDYEGCLSLPGFIGQVRRPQFVRVKFQNRHGEYIELSREGEMARCIEHEIDHLDGVLFIDRMTEDYVYNEGTKERLRVDDLRRLTAPTASPSG